MSIHEVFQLADKRGCTVKTLPLDDSLIYWVENHLFIGKPYRALDDLITFIQTLPERLSTDPTSI